MARAESATKPGVPMLSRGFHDALSLWPAVFWPIVFSSCFYAYIQLCKLLEKRYGFSPMNGRRKSDFLVTYAILPAGAAVEVMVHSYMLYVIGYYYVAVVIPIYVFGWILIPWILDGFRPGLTVLAMTHATFLAAFAVLLGFWDQNVLRALNSDVYTMLTGLPAAL